MLWLLLSIPLYLTLAIQPLDKHHVNTFLYHWQKKPFAPNHVVGFGEIQQDWSIYFAGLETILDRLGYSGYLIITAVAFSKTSLLFAEYVFTFNEMVQFVRYHSF